jgi:Bacterial mobilisation protein (MobC)
MHSTHGGAECSPSFPSAQVKRSDERGAFIGSLVRSEAESFQSRNANPDCVAVNTSIQLQDDSGPDAGQQVVRVEHAHKNLLLANFSTWQGASPIASPVPLDAAGGTRARFHTSDGAPVTANDNALPALRRSGSQKRQRQRKIGVNCDNAEFLAIDHKARTAGVSLASYLRTCALGSPGPRAKRSPPVNAEALANATAALNKAGSNLNQIARVLNASRVTVAAGEYLAVLKDVRSALDQILEIVGRKGRS